MNQDQNTRVILMFFVIFLIMVGLTLFFKDKLEPEEESLESLKEEKLENCNNLENEEERENCRDEVNSEKAITPSLT